FGSARLIASSISGVRLITQTGLPRHSTMRSSPGARFAMSSVTGAPAALARSEGHMLATKGTAAPTPAAPPTREVATMRLRRVLSTFPCSFMGMLLLWRRAKACDSTEGSRNCHEFARKHLYFQRNFVYWRVLSVGFPSMSLHRLWLIFAQTVAVAV